MSHTLGIRSDERALVVGAKRRPVILLSKAAATWSDGRRRNDDCYLVAPVYSFSGDETRASYSAPFIDQVKGYMYWQLFYLPLVPTSVSKKVSCGWTGSRQSIGNSCDRCL